MIQTYGDPAYSHHALAARADRSAQLPCGLVSLALAVLIVYGSLFPFAFHAAEPGGNPLLHLWSTLGDWDRRGDLLSNVIFYAPSGFFGTLTIATRRSVAWRLAVVAGAGVILSTCLETVQFFDVGRVSTLGDVYANAIGSVVGASAALLFGAGVRWSYIQALEDEPFAALLLVAFVGYRLFPYVPVIDLHKYWRAVRDLWFHPMPAPQDLLRGLAGWLFIAALIDGLYGPRRWFLLFPGCLALEMAGRIVIVDASLTGYDVFGGVLAMLIWSVGLAWSRRRYAVVALCFAAMVLAARLQPFTFAAEPLRAFGWIPFWSLMHGSTHVSIQAFFEKVLQDGGMIWLLTRCGLGKLAATGLTVLLLLLVSIAGLYLPDRSAEVTDAVLAAILGVVFAALDGAKRVVPLPQ